LAPHTVKKEQQNTKMKTKTLLIAAAALAAGVISSQAQTPVYSANIVGYVNQPLVSGYVNVANPLDLGAGNSLTNVIQNVPVGGSGPLDGALVYIWNGVGYSIYTLDSTVATGVADSSDSSAVTAPTVSPGQLIFLLNNTGATFTNTAVGTVHVDGPATGSQVVGVTTNVLGTGYSFIASKISVGGGVSSALGLTNTVVSGTGVLDGALLYVPNIVNGNFLGYNITTIDSSTSTGFADSSDSSAVPEPQVPVGTGFVLLNNTGNPYTWVQGL
jgi:hypothetical protein